MKTIPTHPVLETLISNMKDGRITTFMKLKDQQSLGCWLREQFEQGNTHVEQIKNHSTRSVNEYLVTTLVGKVRIGVRGMEIFAILQTS